jgi:hypothetical protein
MRGHRNSDLLEVGAASESTTHCKGHSLDIEICAGGRPGAAAEKSATARSQIQLGQPGDQVNTYMLPSRLETKIRGANLVGFSVTKV